MPTVFRPWCTRIKAQGKIARHHILNDIIWQAFGTAGIPAIKEPSGLDRKDGKRPDGQTLIPWRGGRPLIWNVTVVSPLLASYVERSATNAGTVADMAATRKKLKSTHPYLQYTCLNPFLWKILACSARQR